jgi:hypothetical protein
MTAEEDRILAEKFRALQAKARARAKKYVDDKKEAGLIRLVLFVPDRLKDHIRGLVENEVARLEGREPDRTQPAARRPQPLVSAIANDKAALVALCRELERQGLSQRAIAERLTAEGHQIAPSTVQKYLAMFKEHMSGSDLDPGLV